MERIKTDDVKLTADPISPPAEAASASIVTIADSVCPGCGGAHYYTLKVPYGHADFGRLIRCECQSNVPLPSQVSMAARLRDELGQLANCTFETFDTDRHLANFVWDYNGDEYAVETQRADLVNAYFQAFEYSGSLAGWLYLFGSYGSGKSHLAAAIANKAAGRGTQTTYASVPKLLDFIRAGYKDGTASERIEALSNVPLLVLDDQGAESEKKDTPELLFSLYNHRSRERANLPTVITSNVHPDDLEPRIADRIYGQTDGGALIVWLPICSYRRLR